MSTIATNNITDAAGSGAPNFTNGLKLGTAGVLGPVTGDAPMYACRAWVNFNGTTTPPTIRASGNVSSITDNGTGSYTVNFTTAMPDANYSTVATTSGNRTTITASSYLTSSVTISLLDGPTNYSVGGGSVDRDLVSVAVFR